MKRATLIGTLVASLLTGTAAFAGPGDRGHDGHDWNRGRPQAHHEDRRDYGRHDNDRHDYGRRDYDRHDYRPYAREYYRAPERYGYYRPYTRPYGFYSHRWIRGERLPVAYYSRPYVIDDYYGYGLYAPPRGYHWVHVDGDAVLAAVATGIVLDTVIHAFH